MNSNGFCSTVRWFTLAGAVAGLMTGCAVDQRKEVSTYRSILDLPAIDPAVLEQRQLGVLDTVSLTNARNETLAIEGENYLQSLIDRRRAAAAFLPTITLSPSYFIRDATGSDARSGFNTSVDAGLGLNPVRDIASVRQAEVAAEERRALLLDFQDALLLDAARLHYQAIRADRAVEVLAASLHVQQERVNDAQARLDAGLIRPLDLSLTQAQAAQTESALVQARLQTITARSQLSLLTAISFEDRNLIDDIVLPDHIEPLDHWLDRAARWRQDVIAAELAMQVASHLVESAYGQYFPSVSLNLQWFLQRDSEPTSLDWTSLIQVSIPLFSAGLIEADVRTALSILRQAKLTYSLSHRTARRDVEVAYENLHASFRRTESVRVQVRSAANALEQAEGLWQVGLSTVLERLTARDALLTAELDLVNVELDSKVIFLDLLRTAGILHERFGLQRPTPKPLRPVPGDLHHAVAR